MSDEDDAKRKLDEIRRRTDSITDEELTQIARRTREEFEGAGYSGKDEVGILFGGKRNKTRLQ